MRRAFLLFLLPAILHAADPLPGHSVHGEAFDAGPRQAAVLIEGCGKVSFPITTANPLAQKFFNQGVGQLHGFWYFEAERSFRQVALLDPDCAMAYWGCAMANVNNAKRATGFINEATKRKTSASPREQQWIDALANFYHEAGRDKKTRQMDFIQDTEAIIHDHPEDLEAKAFLAWAIWHAKEDGVPMVSREAVDAVISQVLAIEPMHPVHHYRIHLWDDTKPIRAVVSADLCGQSAPAIAHMWHMPGHTYSKVDRLEDAAWQQEAAARVDHAYMIRTQILPDQIHNYAHNSEWLIRTLDQLGEAGKAVTLAKNLVEMPRHPTWNTLDKGSNTSGFGRTRLLETLLKFELWKDLRALDGTPYLDETENPGLEAERHRALGIADFFLGDDAGVREHLAAITRYSDQLGVPASAPKALTSPTISAPASNGVPPPNLPAVRPSTSIPRPPIPGSKPRAITTSPTPKGKSTLRVEEALDELKALDAILTPNNQDAAVTLLQRCRAVPKERMVHYYIKLGRDDKALALAKQLPSDAPGLALRVTASMECGKPEEAKAAFQSLREKAASMDADLPMARRIDQIAPQLGFPTGWRQPKPLPHNHGVRPALDTLGPLSWHPFPAQPFVLQSNQQRLVSFKDFTGKPVVILFYLGGACEHCVQQLKSFSALTKEFNAAGIDIVAVGSEVADDLNKTQLLCDAKAGVPFPLLADPELKTFKSYRCYDDFEHKPLHGTFLVDGAGQVRWLDVSYEPFLDAAFLLKEANRLLVFSK